MASFRAAEVPLLVGLAIVCGVAGFAVPPVGNAAYGLVSPPGFTSTSSAAAPHMAPFAPRTKRGRGLAVLEATDGQDDGIEEYKKQMAEFMAQAHDKRLQAMEAVKAEVQRGYEEQIADLQAKLSALPSSATASDIAEPVRVAEPALAAGGAAASSASVGSAAKAPHPAYAARAERPGWEARWGTEEADRASTSKVSAADVTSMEAKAASVISPGGAVHPAYAARSQRPGWEARWGEEELARTSGVQREGDLSIGTHAEIHPAYAARAQRPGWEERWGSEEPARVAGATASAAIAPGAATQAPTAAVSVDAHPAYSARLQRPGWEERWGSEEKERVKGAPAGVIAVEGSAAGFVTAGGLDVQPETAVQARAISAPAVSTLVGSGDPLEDSLPEDAVELKGMVVSFRRHFQDYLMRSLEASNDLKASKAKIEGDLSGLSAKLGAEEVLRATLQESFLGYMTRSGEAGASGKIRIGELESDVTALTAQASELQRFTQEYMVKAAIDKQNAVEEAVARGRAEAGERIAALEAQVLELQAGV